jgi:hypothetical protein
MEIVQIHQSGAKTPIVVVFGMRRLLVAARGEAGSSSQWRMAVHVVDVHDGSSAEW